MVRIVNFKLTCADKACQLRETCSRWHCRERSGVSVVRAFTLRPQWQCHNEVCDYWTPTLKHRLNVLCEKITTRVRLRGR